MNPALFTNHVSLHPVVFLHKYKNQIPSHTTPFFLLLHYFVATCFGPSGPSSGHTGAVSEAKLYVKLQLKYIKSNYVEYIEFLS
jgi:hypothetical protein